MWTSLSKLTVFVLIVVSMLAVASCSLASAPAWTPTPLIETPACTEKMIPATITEIQPSPVTPGSEITITGTGGYLQDSCGGINESARSFKLYLDKEPVGNLSCYVNHCETKILLADTIASGEHCLSTQKDICEFQFQVVSK